MSFFSSLSASISRGIAALGDEIKKLAQHFPPPPPLVQATAEEVGTAVLKAVVAQAPLLISGQEKMAGAVANVRATLIAEGKTASLTLLEAAAQEAHDQLAATIHAPAQ